MKSIAEKIKARVSNLKQEEKRILIIGAFALLTLLLCISFVMQLNIHHKYTRVAESITEQIFQKLISMEELFSYVDEENIDVRNKLIPQMRAQYTAAVELNNVLVNNFGERYRVLSVEQIGEFDAAFRQYTGAISSGLSMNLARDDMAVLLAELQDMINARYNPTPAPTTTPVTIDDND